MAFTLQQKIDFLTQMQRARVSAVVTYIVHSTEVLYQLIQENPALISTVCNQNDMGIGTEAFNDLVRFFAQPDINEFIRIHGNRDVPLAPIADLPENPIPLADLDQHIRQVVVEMNDNDLRDNPAHNLPEIAQIDIQAQQHVVNVITPDNFHQMVRVDPNVLPDLAPNQWTEALIQNLIVEEEDDEDFEYEEDYIDDDPGY